MYEVHTHHIWYPVAAVLWISSKILKESWHFAFFNSQFSSSNLPNSTLWLVLVHELHLNIVFILFKQRLWDSGEFMFSWFWSLYMFLVVTNHHTEAVTHSCGSVCEEMGRVAVAQNLLWLICVPQTSRTVPGSVRKSCQQSKPQRVFLLPDSSFHGFSCEQSFKTQSSGAVTFSSSYRVNRIRNSSCRRFVQLLRKPWPNLLMAWAELPRALQLN